MFWSAVLIVVVICMAYDSWYRGRLHRVLSCIPSTTLPCCPILGHAVLFLGNGEDRMSGFKQLSRNCNSLGGVMIGWLGRRAFLCVTDPVLAENILKTYLDKDNLMKLLQKITGNGSIFAPESIWRHRRKLLVPAFSPKMVKNFVEIFEENADELVKKLELVSDKGPISMWKYLTAYTMDAVSETNLNIKMHSQRNPDQSFVRAFGKATDLLAQRICQPWLQNDYIYNLLPQGKTLNKSVKKLHDFVKKIIYNRKREITLEIENTTESDRHHAQLKPGFKSFLDKLMELSEQSCNQYDDSVLIDECLVISLAGTDTSAVGACFTLCMLARHPEIQQKAYEEVQYILGDNKRPITNEDLANLRYVDAVIRETLRLYPPVPVVVRKVDKREKPPSIPELVPGMGIVILIWGVHRNPKYWGDDAEEFRPERFLEAKLPHPAAFMPFSNGPRVCLGYQYAMLSMKAVVSFIIREFIILPPDADEKSSASLPTGLKNKKQKELRVNFDIMMRDVENFSLALKKRH